jgi:SAM-dependent methyltransferase
MGRTPPPPPDPTEPRQGLFVPTYRTRLVLLSFLMLFVELALIRWTGSNVVYLSYFSNFVLLGSFLGIGLGFLRARARVNLWHAAPLALALLVAFVRLFPVEIDRSSGDLLYFGQFSRTGLPIWLTLPAIFLAVAAVMMMIAEGVARTFGRFTPLEAYRLDILGSIAGIIVFSWLSFLHAPPVAWGVVVALVFIVLYGRAGTLIQGLAIGAMVALLAWESLAPQDSWSPYYKVTVRPGIASQVYDVSVNGVPHQAIESTELRRQLEPVYFLPYQRIASPPAEDILIVGAGAGADVAIALQQGARRVDAVEIDPRLYELGAELNPDRPYSDPRVHVFVDDGRAFMERTDRRYDLILFALPDSITLVSGQSSLRLESYLFTLEALQEARSHLKRDGVFAMYNFYREPWLIDRFARTLEQAYGRRPCADIIGESVGLALLTAGRSPVALRCDTVWDPTSQRVPPSATDDYPFPYLRDRSIPAFHLLTIALILGASLLAVRATTGPLMRMGEYIDLFFMGAAFLLLETKNVVQFALLFGTTWLVNSLVFTGVLLSVLAAVEVARHITFRHPARLYGALVAALIVSWLIPSSSLLPLPVVLRFLAATALAFTPIFLANLVFADRFRDVGSSTVAFGANLLGAMVGGIAEYGALLTGYRALLVMAATLYGLAFLFGYRHLSARGRGRSRAAAPH